MRATVGDIARTLGHDRLKRFVFLTDASTSVPSTNFCATPSAVAFSVYSVGVPTVGAHAGPVTVPGARYFMAPWLY